MHTDKYRLLAARYYGVPYDAVTDGQRRAAKAASFACIYGAERAWVEAVLDSGAKGDGSIADIVVVPGAPHR